MENQTNILKAVKLLKKNIWMMVVVSLITSIGTFFITKEIVTPEYQSLTQLIGKSTVPIQSDTREDLNAANYKLLMINTYKSLIKSSSILSSVETQVNKETNKNFNLDQLKSMITVKQEEDSQVFNLFVVYKDPEIAKFINSCIASSLEKNISDLLGKENAVSIVSPTTVSDVPVSPNIKLNTALGFILGLLISLLIIYLKSLKDSTLDIEDNIEKELKLTNLGHVSTIKIRSKKELAIEETTSDIHIGGKSNEKIASRRRNRR